MTALCNKEMAEKTIQIEKVEEQLNCSICLETYTDPKLLQCFHVYCQKCLVKLVDRDQQGQLIISCPICRHATPVPANGVAGLQSAFLITPLLDIVKAGKANVEGVDLNDSPSPPLVKICCRSHIGKEVELFCETCEEPICLKCVVKSGEHFGHETELINEAFEKYKGDIVPSLEKMEKQLTTIDKALAQLDGYCTEISDQQMTIQENIDETFRQLQEVLHARKTELNKHLDQITQAKLKELNAQRDEMETTKAQLCSSLDFIQKSLETDSSQREVLMMKMTIVKQVKELTTTLQPDLLKPRREADVFLSVSHNLSRECQNYGQVSIPSAADPSKCCTSGKGLEVAVVGIKSTAVLQAIDFMGHPCQEPIKLECELTSEITGTRVRGDVERRDRDSHYEISFQPTVKGKHKLHITVEGQHIRGSPFCVAVTSPVQQLSAPILTINDVEGPCGVAINQQGEVIVSDWEKHCVSIFSPCGEKLRSFGAFGSGEGQFDGPIGMTVDAEGNILVVDCWNHRIQKFTATGQILEAVGASGNGRLQFWNPRGIAVNAKNNKIYVCDTRNNRVQVLNSNLTFSSFFGKRGSNKGRFDRPYGIACDSTGCVYVADSNNHRIQVFTAEGKFMKMFGGRGELKGELMQPTGVAIGASGMVYVVECGNHRVSVFNTDGQHVTSFGRKRDGEGKLDFPIGLAVDSDGVVYVCDNNCVVVF